MRIRTIKPEFWESESLGKVSREARLLFIGLFSSCDDSGRTRASSRLLASRLYPYDDDAFRLLPRWLKELEDQNCIRVYEVDGETYLDIPKWLSHQKIDHPSKSKIPEFREGSRGFEKNSLGSGIRDQGSGSGSGELENPREEEVEKQTRKGTLEEVQAACRAKGLPDTDSEWFFHKMEGNGWCNNGKPIKQWKSVVASWFAAAYFPSQKNKPHGTSNQTTNAAYSRPLTGAEQRQVGIPASTGDDYWTLYQQCEERKRLAAEASNGNHQPGSGGNVPTDGILV